MNMTRWILIGIFSTIMLFGCSSEPEKSVVEFVDYTKKKKTSIKPIPEFKKPEPFFYNDSTLRDPFNEQKNKHLLFQPQNIKASIGAKSAGPSPNFQRRKEPLEDLPLDSLKMVGILSTPGKVWGLVKDPDGVIHRVSVGNYLGQNYGLIKKIGETRIDLQEFFSNGEGGWIERKSALKMEVKNQSQQ